MSTATVAFAHTQNQTAYVTIAVNGAPQAEVRDLAKEAFTGLGVTFDGLANSHKAFGGGNYFTYSQAVA